MRCERCGSSDKTCKVLPNRAFVDVRGGRIAAAHFNFGLPLVIKTSSRVQLLGGMVCRHVDCGVYKGLTYMIEDINSVNLLFFTLLEMVNKK